MKIKQVTSQSRRDFTAVFECEHCGHTTEGDGYDDVHFHQHAIPAMKCGECGRVAGDTYRPLAPRYAAHEIV